MSKEKNFPQGFKRGDLVCWVDDADKKDFSKLRFIDYYNNFKQFMNVIEFNELNNLF